MISVEARNSTNELASSETTTAPALAREETSAGFFNTKKRGEKMKKAYDLIRNSNRFAMSEYDRNYFAKHPEQNDSWSSVIKPEEAYDEIAPENIDTEPMPYIPSDLEIIEEADSLEDALKAYDARYSLEEIDAGKQSPQLCADMLLRIKEKFDENMSPEQEHAVCLEIIEVGHAIGHLASLSDEETEQIETQDRTSLKGLANMAKIITIAQEHAPDDLPLLKKEIEQVADCIDSRVSEPISGPIRIALLQFEEHPENSVPFIELVDEIDHNLLNVTEASASIKLNELKEAKERREKEAREAKERQEKEAREEALKAAEQAKREEERQKLANLGVEDSVDFDDAAPYDPFADDDEDEAA